MDISTSPTNCGECGNSCGAGEVCMDGGCAAECPAGLAECVGTCVDTQSDPDHCGECASPCSAGLVCLDGDCVEVCPAPRIACGGSCIDPQTDRTHCGGCDNECGAGLVCSEGVCGTTCQDELTMCGDRCVDPMEDRDNCGSCDHACDAGYVCNAGACVFACPPGQTLCGLACTNTSRDRAHCGDCVTACIEGEYCEAGECTPTCSPGLEVCDGACVDTDHDIEHCGGCDFPCGDEQVCVDGECRECDGCDRRVLVIHAANAGYVNDVLAKLRGLGVFQVVDGFEGNAGTPTLDRLQEYDVVLVFSDSGFQNATALGDVVADYYDRGGYVVIAVFANASIPIRGRFGTVGNGYMLINPTGQEQPTDSIGRILEPESPLVRDVERLNANSAYRSTGGAINGGTVVAEWEDGRPLIVRGEVDGRRRVDINMYPPSSDARADFHSGDGTFIMRNALLYR